MSQRAHVTSVEALEAFRASLILYLSKARPALEEASGEVLRTRLWLQNDQRLLLERELRRRARALEDAQQALFSAKLSNLREVSAAEIAAVNKAKRAFDEVETKLRRLKQWNRDFDSRVEPVAKHLGKLQAVLSDDMSQAVAYLAQAVATLDDYAGVAPPSITDAPAGAPSKPASDATASGEAAPAGGAASADAANTGEGANP